MANKSTEVTTVIADLKSQKLDTFLSTNGEPSVSIHDEGKIKCFFIDSGLFRDWIIRRARNNGWKISANRRQEIIEELVAMATESSEKKSLFVRVAAIEGKIFVDLNDDTNKMVEVDAVGFRVVNNDSVRFIRPAKQKSLPVPVTESPAKFFTKLAAMLSLDDCNTLLLIAFLLKSLHRDHGSYAFLILEGPQGSGKTTISNRLKMLIDPSDPLSYSPPNHADDIIVASTHSFLLVFDNISGINGTMADYFCRLSSGGGIAKRKLFHDDAEKVYLLHRPGVINGIEEPTNRSDFLDRCISIELKPLEDSRRTSETILDSAFNKELPYLLGGLYNTLSKCLHELPKVPTTNLPRMTDFARMGIALERVLKLKEGSFLKAYRSRKNEQEENAFWTDEVCNAIFSYLNTRNTPIEGNASEIKDLLFRGRLGERSSGPPMSIKNFAARLKRVEPLLKVKGIVVERPPRTSGKRLIRIFWKDKGENIEIISHHSHPSP